MMREQFKSRVLQRGGTSEMADKVDLAFKIVDSFQAKVKTIKADPTLSPAGVAKAVAEARKGGLGEHLAQIRDEIAAAVENTKAARARLVPEAPNSGDLIGEMRRGEIRAWLRGLTLSERVKHAVSSTDPEIVAAIVHAPSEISGLPAQVHGAVVDKVVQEIHGERLARLSALQAGYEEASAALAVADGELDRAARVDGVAA